MNNSEIPIVAYIAYEPFGFNYFESFINNYTKYESGAKHDLLICFKSFKNIKSVQSWKNNVATKFIDFFEENQQNDFDIGSYFRIAEKYPSRPILFLDTYTKPVCKNWLKIFISNYESKKLLGATASYASLTSMFLNFYFNKHSKFQQIRWGVKSWINVKTFPNPHIRTTGFMIKGEELLNLNFDRNKFVKKIETNYFEGGRNSLTNQLKLKGFEILLLNSDGNSYAINDWKKSKTYCLENQQKLIFIDNRTKEYQDANDVEREKFRKFTWGID